jgi:hypothetical protein
MKKFILGFLALIAPTSAYAESDFPGSAWVNVTGPHVGGGEKGNWVITAKANQDAVLTEVSDWKLSSFVSVSLSTDSKGYEWNNRVTPAVGMKITRDVPGGIFDIGVQYAHETHFGKLYKMPDRSSGGIQVSVNYWTGWGR